MSVVALSGRVQVCIKIRFDRCAACEMPEHVELAKLATAANAAIVAMQQEDVDKGRYVLHKLT